MAKSSSQFPPQCPHHHHHHQRPFILAMKGHPGTGKSTLARALSSALRLPLLDKDDIRDSTLHLHPLLPKHQSQPLLNDLSYQVLFALARTQISLGLSVILDSPLSSKGRLEEVVKLGAGRVVVVECKPGDEAEWRRRLEERGRKEGEEGGGGHKPKTWKELTRLREGYNGCDEYDLGDAVERIVVDTTAAGVTTEEMVNRVVQQLMMISN